VNIRARTANLIDILPDKIATRRFFAEERLWTSHMWLIGAMW